MTHTSTTTPPATGRALARWGSVLAGCAGALALALLLSRLTRPLWGFGLPLPPHHVRPFLGIAALALFGLAQGPLPDLLPARGLLVRGLDPAALRTALDRRGVAYRPHDDGSLCVVGAGPERVGPALADAGVAVLEMRREEGTGLEELFLSLSADARAAVPA